jgi:hypothetical protein
MRSPHIALALLLTLAACGGGTQFALVGTAEVDGTYGAIEVEPVEGGGSALTVVLDELPRPERLGEGVVAYVAWIEPPSGEPTRVGALAYDAEARQGTVTATTPLREFRFVVTAEQTDGPASPADLVVADKHIVLDP